MLPANPRAVEEWLRSITDLYNAKGKAGLRELPGIEKSLALDIIRWLGEKDVGLCKAHL